ncbi:MAG: DNA polymerase clamp loader subunit A [Thermodesulfobacteriota bacterium]
MTPFDIIRSVTDTKERIIDFDNEKEYNAFIVNRGLSLFPDTIMYAQEMNVLRDLDPVLQYDYLLNSIRKKKRWAKWPKKEDEELLKIVMEYFSYNRERAREAMLILSEDQLNHIAESMLRGRK